MRTARSGRLIAVIGAGRLGTALAAALRRAGHDVCGPLGRGYAPDEVAGAEIALLCVPDGQIPAAAAAWRASGPAGALVGHCSGATGLDALDPGSSDAPAVFSLHPLMTFAAGGATAPRLDGAAAAVAGSDAPALAAAVALAEDLGLAPVPVAEADRAAYHAAASIASNYLVALECAAETLAATCGVSREMLAPLVRATVDNWVRSGQAALTGPVARGDRQTVAAQRAAVAERAPEQLELFDALTEATRRLAAPRELAA